MRPLSLSRDDYKGSVKDPTTLRRVLGTTQDPTRQLSQNRRQSEPIQLPFLARTGHHIPNWSYRIDESLYIKNTISEDVQSELENSRSRLCALQTRGAICALGTGEAPPPRPAVPEVPMPLDTSLLHVGRSCPVSSQTGTPIRTVSSSTLLSSGKVASHRVDGPKKRIGPIDRPFECEHCGRDFLWNKDLVRHLVKHTRWLWHCPAYLCSKSYARRDNMVRHHIDAHPDLPPLRERQQTPRKPSILGGP